MLNNKIYIIIILLIIGFGSGYLLGNDNPVEEITEHVIDQEIGVNVDLTPNSPENINENR